MNTRLQVEHPVTEEITGVDLVEWQLRVASGEPLPLRQDQLKIDGWAMEARLYAEDPATGFLPSTGRLEHFIIPSPPDLDDRIETGVEPEHEISPFYDPMIAKIVVHATTRAQACDDLERICAGVEVWPVRTNAGFLTRLLSAREFISGNVTTSYIADHIAHLAHDPTLSESMKKDAAATLIAREIQPISSIYGSVAEELHLSGSADVWRQCYGFRLNARRRTAVVGAIDGEPFATMEQAPDWLDRFTSSEATADGIVVFDRGEALHLRTRADVGGTHGAADGAILAPMPGKVIAVDVTESQAVTKGQRLMVLEAMKMEHALTAPFDGTVRELAVHEGQQVQVEALLARVERTE
jgi:3-methylcrotonyl-CoA carboxylase alpha subunit